MIKDFYKVDSVARHDDGAVYRVSLNPDCEVYKGHFPGNPISPGVCGIQMIRECLWHLLLGKEMAQLWKG